MKRTFIVIFLLFCVTGCFKNSGNNSVDWDNTYNPPSQAAPQPKSDYSATAQTLLSLHNRERELKGRAGVAIDPYLMKYAQTYAESMAQSNRLVHSNISILMSKYSTAGENIAWNQRTEKEVIRDWMDSSGHRANIMNRNFTKVGFGVARAKNGSLYWCTVFGS